MCFYFKVHWFVGRSIWQKSLVHVEKYIRKSTQNEQKAFLPLENSFLYHRVFTFVAELDPSHLSFSSKSTSKKKRKSRTAFTNHQIFELEKRFLYQKYLSPADRDEIAAHLGLTNAQVQLCSITMSELFHPQEGKNISNL